MNTIKPHELFDLITELQKEFSLVGYLSISLTKEKTTLELFRKDDKPSKEYLFNPSKFSMSIETLKNDIRRHFWNQFGRLL